MSVTVTRHGKGSGTSENMFGYVVEVSIAGRWLRSGAFVRAQMCVCARARAYLLFHSLRGRRRFWFFLTCLVAAPTSRMPNIDSGANAAHIVPAGSDQIRSMRATPPPRAVRPVSVFKLGDQCVFLDAVKSTGSWETSSVCRRGGIPPDVGDAPHNAADEMDL